MPARVAIDIDGAALSPARRGPILERGVRDSVGVVTGHGLSELRTEFGKHFRNPTGYYEMSTYTEVRGGIGKVSDGGVIYGPWLEGTGSRNRTTRFKGYRSFRITTQRVQNDVVKVTQFVWDRVMRQLNG